MNDLWALLIIPVFVLLWFTSGKYGKGRRGRL